MKPLNLLKTLVSSCALFLAMSGMAMAATNPCAPRNPCAMKHNPCAMKNPCGMKKMNPCAAKAANPCAASDRVNPALITRPDNYRPYQGKQADLVKYGKKLFNDTKLSSNGLSCSACHANYASFQDSFAKPYPHPVQMVNERSGKKTIHLDEMVQICMVVPMAAKPLPWDSKELAALTAYAAELQKGFKPGKAGAMGNPCAAKNPCAMKRNPCAMKNPCATKKH